MTSRPNVIILSADSLRADHLGCYGYPKTTSPHIDALAREGAVCERVICEGIPTMPSYTTLYTSQHPVTHDIVAHPCKNELDKTAPFLPQAFLEEGYNTCAVDSLMRSRLWFGRGYEFYIDPSLRHTLLYLAVTCDDLHSRAIPWIRRHGDEPFFLFIHYWDTHWPFNPPERYRGLFYEGNPTDPANHSLDKWWEHPLGATARETWMRTQDGLVTDAEYVTALYDQEIRYLDDGIGELVSSLDEMGLSENTLLVFTADHGESMTEHGIYFDHHGLYEPTLHIPLIARWPGKIPAGIRVPQLMQVSDIAPTVMEAAGVPSTPGMEGESMWKLLTGEARGGGRDRVVSLECTWQAKWSLRTNRYKFILARVPDTYGNPPRELYDLEADPGERHNRVHEEPDVAAAMEEELEGWIAERLEAQGKLEDPLLKHGVSLSSRLIAAGQMVS